MKKVIIDTNALMGMAEYKIDLFAEIEHTLDIPYQVTILRETITELKKIQQQEKNKFRRYAKLALDIITAKKVLILPEEGFVDNLLVQHSQHGDLILTQDVALKKRLTRPYLTIRQKKRIIMVE